MRNAGHRNFYRRGRVYYRVKYGVWTSLRTTDRREALKRLRDLETQEITAKALEKLRLVARLHALEKRIAEFRPSAEARNSLAPWIANTVRGDFGEELEKFLARMPAVAKGTKTMWKTAKNNLLRLLSNLTTFEGTALSGTHWQKLETLTPTGLWSAFRAQKKASRGKNAQDAAFQATTGNSSANHLASFFRRFVPDFVERGFLPLPSSPTPKAFRNLLSIRAIPKSPHLPKWRNF